MLVLVLTKWGVKMTPLRQEKVKWLSRVVKWLSRVVKWLSRVVE